MRGWFLVFLFLFFSKNSFADASCIGETSCKILDDITKNSNLSLELILNKLDKNIVIPMLDQQLKVNARDYSRLNFSLNGAKQNNKLSINIGGVISNEILNSSLFNSNFNYQYIIGGGRPSFVIEIPDNNLNLIINLSYWNDRADFYFTNNNVPNSKDFIFSFGERYFFTNNKVFNLSIINGFIFGSKIIELHQPGSIFYITLPNNSLTWGGEEYYKQTINFISLPNYIIASAKFYDITFAGIAQYSFVYMNGISTISKIGAVGPILGKNSYLNIGAQSEKYINNVLLFPEFGLGLEYELNQLFITCIYQKSPNYNLDKASFGMGMIF